MKADAAPRRLKGTLIGAGALDDAMSGLLHLNRHSLELPRERKRRFVGPAHW